VVSTNGGARDVSSGRRASSGPLRLAVVADAVAPWSYGGREVRYAELLGRLSEAGVDVTVFTMKWWDEPPPGAIRHVAIFPKMPMYRRGRRSIRHALAFSIGSFRLLFESFDVILTDHIPFLHLLPLRIISLVRRRPLLVEWHEYWGDVYWRQYLGTWGRAASLMESASLRLPTSIVAVTPELGDKIRSCGIEVSRVHVVGNGVSKRSLDAVESAHSAPDVICVGRLIDHKRMDVALRSFSLLAARDPQLRLGIVGEGPERDRLEQLALDVGVADRCTFFGTLPNTKELWQIIKAASVLLFPSEREGFGLVVAESLALGTPVVCGGGPGNEARRLVTEGRTGRIVMGSVPSDFADALWSVLSSHADPSEVSATFWRDHPTLDWDASALAALAVLHEAVGR
jgi:glycosyltransferase involved in cell wall biosynthesis